MDNSPSIKIYQTYINEADLTMLDPSFIPNDWRHNPNPELREIAIFFDFFDYDKYKTADFVGVLSKKFTEKTKFSGKKFIDFIYANPGYDVYFINPFPQDAYFSYNVWHQGELYHPGIINATQYLFDRAGIATKVDSLGRNDYKTLLYSNYWVGNTKFWKTYIPFLQHIFNTIFNMDETHRQLFFNDTPHYDSHAPLFPFIFERLFSTFLLLNKEIKYCAYQHSKEEVIACCLNENQIKICESFGKQIDELDQSNVEKNYMRTFLNNIAIHGKPYGN